MAKKQIEEILEVVTYMKDNMVTKVEFDDFKIETRQEFAKVKEKITAVENNLVNRFDNELDSRGKLEARVTQLEKVRK